MVLYYTPKHLFADCGGEPTELRGELISASIKKWTPIEEDDIFLKKVIDGISLLDKFPNGKMTLTRSYERKLPVKYNPFELYKLHAGRNGDYACSHYFSIGDSTYSLGCTPENVFTISNRQIFIDVVAGTCKAGSDNYVTSELIQNTKQIKEHSTSLHNRFSRYEAYCVKNSLDVTSRMNIKSLRNVFHLYSVISGELLPKVTMFDLLVTAFPLLSARPKDLLPFYENSETCPHRYYSGIVGHRMRDVSNCFLNLRNALIADNVMYAKVGVGLIAESDPLDELLETRNKISSLMESVYLWERGYRKDKSASHE
jgi:anthranilate/para-aminobenzoate synthase component I